MDTSTAADGFAAMGSDARLSVLHALVKAGGDGLYVGEIQERTDIPASTLAHHLKALALAGLIRQEKQGRSTLNTAHFDHLKGLADYILSECCSEPRQAQETAA